MKHSIPICISILIMLCLSPASGQNKPDGKKAWAHVEFLASDAFQGRRAGTPGYEKAARYVAGKMKEYGFEPGGENGTYFQQVEFKNWRQFDPPTRLEVLTPRPLKFTPGRSRDFSPNSGIGSGSGIARGRVVFAGYGLRSEDPAWDDYSGLEIEDKIVMIIPGAPKFLEGLEVKDKSLKTKIQTAIDLGAAGLLIMNIENGLPRRSMGGGTRIEYPDNFIVLNITADALDRMFSPLNKSWRFLVSNTLREKSPHSLSLDLWLEMEAHFTQEDRTAPNVIGLLPGKHPQRKEEYLILGGHLDHLGLDLDGSIYNGAGDNATSAAVILELARVFQKNGFRPDRSLVFIAWAGEEQGLKGSRFYTEHPLFPLEKSIYMNIDMVGCGDEDLFVGGMWEFSEFYEIIKQGLSAEMKDRLRYRIEYRGSDHSAFLPKGVTAVSLRSGNPLTRELDDEHPEYHRLGDDAGTIEPELLALAAQYHSEVLTHLAGCDEDLFHPRFHAEFIHKDSDLSDLHCDTISRVLRGIDLTQDHERGHIDIPKLKRGAVDLQVFACYVGPPGDELQKNQAAKTVFSQIDAVHRLVADNPDDLLLVQAPQDLRGLRGNRKVGTLISIEGGYAIENDLSLLRSFYRTGVRMMTLTHWLDTDWADASGDPEAQLEGLTEFGESVVREMDSLGMIIDVSHVHDETFWDVLKITKKPIIASHSCCRALSEHHRNLSDEMLEALGKNGGVIGINYAPGFLNSTVDLKVEALRQELLTEHGLPEDREAYAKADPSQRLKFASEYREKSIALKKSLPPVDVRTVVDHIDHVVNITGNTNHVGLGSDFDGIGSTPEGLEHVGKVAAITTELVKRGYEDKDIKKILGGNFIRVFNRVCGQRR